MENDKELNEPSFDVVLNAVNAGQDAKARNPVALKLKGLSDICQYFLIVSARSDRHAQGIANRILGEFNKQGREPDSIEGFNTGHWILLDYGDVVIHVFYEPIRGRYDLEGLWGKAERFEFECTDDTEDVAA
jgi:ribosome-associated protein